MRRRNNYRQQRTELAEDVRRLEKSLEAIGDLHARVQVRLGGRLDELRAALRESLELTDQIIQGKHIWCPKDNPFPRLRKLAGL